MLTRIAPKHARFHFASLHALATYNAETPAVWHANQSRNWPAETSWDLNTGYDAALALASHGWIEGAQRAKQALKAFAPVQPEKSRKMDVVGQRVSVPRYLTGHPKNMVRNVKTAGTPRILTLAVNVSCSVYADAECMSNYGIGIAQYVNTLERSGVRVHLIGSIVQEDNGRKLAVSWTIKSAGQSMDLAALAFAIGHPAMFRRIGFAFMERQSAIREMSGYGMPTDTKLTDLIDPPANTFVLNGMNGANRHARTPDDALAYVTSQLDAMRKAA